MFWYTKCKARQYKTNKFNRGNRVLQGKELFLQIPKTSVIFNQNFTEE